MGEIDLQLFRFLHRAFSGGWLAPMAALSAIGGGWGSLAVIPLLAKTRTRRVGSSLAAVLAATAVLVFVLKRVVARVRPCGCLADIRALVLDPPTDFSFPSGHAAGSFAFTVFVATILVRTTPRGAPARERLLRSSGAVGLVLLAAGVALSRIALGVHFPGDVTAGALLGTTIATIGARLHLEPLRNATVGVRDEMKAPGKP